MARSGVLWSDFINSTPTARGQGRLARLIKRLNLHIILNIKLLFDNAADVWQYGKAGYLISLGYLPTSQRTNPQSPTYSLQYGA